MLLVAIRAPFSIFRAYDPAHMSPHMTTRPVKHVKRLKTLDERHLADLKIRWAEFDAAAKKYHVKGDIYDFGIGEDDDDQKNDDSDFDERFRLNNRHRALKKKVPRKALCSSCKGSGLRSDETPCDKCMCSECMGELYLCGGCR
jgi:hypothetical protein